MDKLALALAVIASGLGGYALFGPKEEGVKPASAEALEDLRAEVVSLQAALKQAHVATTELVSWIASADQSPNSSCERSSQWPISGKVNNATTLSRKTRLSVTAVSWGRAPITGLSVAMVVPPQMAVPETINADGMRSERSARLYRSITATFSVGPSVLHMSILSCSSPNVGCAMHAIAWRSPD